MALRPDKLSMTSMQALQDALGYASEKNSAMVEPLHLLHVLLDKKGSNLPAIIKRIGADPSQLLKNVDAEIDKMPKVNGSLMVMANPSQAFLKVFDEAVAISEKLGDE